MSDRIKAEQCKTSVFWTATTNVTSNPVDVVLPVKEIIFSRIGNGLMRWKNIQRWNPIPAKKGSEHPTPLACRQGIAADPSYHLLYSNRSQAYFNMQVISLIFQRHIWALEFNCGRIREVDLTFTRILFTSWCLGTILQVQFMMGSCAFKRRPNPLSKAITVLQTPRQVLHSCWQ